jgi:quinol monooxygenase YgiN
LITLVVHHRVSDYDTWKPVFDEHEGIRRSHGEVEHRIYQVHADPNSVAIHNDFPSVEAARGFLADPSLLDAMARGGVEGEPGTGFLELTERKVYVEGHEGRPVILVVHHRVNDFGVWKPVFDEHEGVRRGHGELEHRMYQDPLEPNRIVIHNDFPSEEAARGFMADPSLEEAMERGGVKGEPGIGLAKLAEQKVYADSPTV